MVDSFSSILVNSLAMGLEQMACCKTPGVFVPLVVDPRLIDRTS